ncbi:MAG: hypothetical protein M3Q22_15065, partial [Actinomycetota bacterium]|nr:hypothetical protein [Actinomycetota bacterium]
MTRRDRTTDQPVRGPTRDPVRGHLVEWRKARDAGALAGLSAARGRPPADPVERENARLQKE